MKFSNFLFTKNYQKLSSMQFNLTVTRLRFVIRPFFEIMSHSLSNIACHPSKIQAPNCSRSFTFWPISIQIQILNHLNGSAKIKFHRAVLDIQILTNIQIFEEFLNLNFKLFLLELKEAKIASITPHSQFKPQFCSIFSSNKV